MLFSLVLSLHSIQSEEEKRTKSFTRHGPDSYGPSIKKKRVFLNDDWAIRENHEYSNSKMTTFVLPCYGNILMKPIAIKCQTSFGSPMSNIEIK